VSHLGQRISALIDGELTDAERDRVLTHLAGCDVCRQEAVALRALKQRMHSLGEAMVDAALTGRLMAMAPGEGSGWAGRAPWRSKSAFPATRLLTAGLLASAMTGLGATAFFVGGDPQTPGPKVTPAVDTFLVQHAVVTGDMPVAPVTAPAASGSSGPAPQRAAVAHPVNPAGQATASHPPAASRHAASRMTAGPVATATAQASAAPGVTVGP
jgi:anti-sigma factor RsiW